MGLIDFLEDHMLSCRWKELGVECLGCGFQRSVIYLLKGEFVQAFWSYPAIYSLVTMLMFLFFHMKFNYARGHLILKWLFILNVLIMVGNYVYKII